MLSVPEELQWHLKGTAAERVIQEARKAAREFHQRGYAAWRDLRQALEAACGLPEGNDYPHGQDREPHLLRALKNQLHDSFFLPLFQRPAPGLEWLEWDVYPHDPLVLRLKRQFAAVGSPEVHQRVMEAVVAFLTNNYRGLQQRFVAVKRLRDDLGLFQQVLTNTMASVTEDEVRRRICPACPYPEAQVEWGSTVGQRNRRAKPKTPRREPSEAFT